MAKQSFRIQLVEGGEGIVAEGDPAYEICKRLRKEGFTNIIIPLTTLATGQLSEKLLDAEMDDSETFERMAGYYEQAAHVTDIDTDCVHHYILTEPTPGKNDQGTCKWCGNEREYGRFTEIAWSSEEAQARTYALQEWRKHLTEEENLIGLGHNSDDTYPIEEQAET